MPKTVELGSHLTDLCAHELIMTDKLVLTGRAAGRRAGNDQAVVAARKQGYPCLVDSTQFVDFAFPYQCGGFQYFLIGKAIRSTAFIRGAPFRRPPNVLGI